MLKQLEVEQLEKQAGVKAPVIDAKVNYKVSSSAYYRPIKGDLVDEMVGNNLTDMQSFGKNRDRYEINNR